MTILRIMSRTIVTVEMDDSLKVTSERIGPCVRFHRLRYQNLL